MDDAKLIAEARAYLGTFALSKPDLVAGEVAAAILADNGRVYTGISIHLSCGIGFCAEHAAVAEMLKNRTTLVRTAVAVSHEGVVPPCGRCRELLLQIDRRNHACVVILPHGRKTLAELLPDHWLPA